MPGRQILNAVTIDLEDWLQGAVSPDRPITSRVVRNVDRVLQLLDRHNVRATFFALGKVCEEFPQLLPKIAAAGHEIGSHGYGHRLLYRISPEQFRKDITRSIEIIEKQTGTRPIGYRAPGFSITRESWWAGPILSEMGLRYSSSVFPIRGRRYGVPDAPRFPFRWRECDLVEFPLTTVRLMNRNLPMCGGGYFRLLPWPILAGAIRRVNREGRPAVVYLHPYELDVTEPAELRRQGHQFSLKTYVKQSLFRGRVLGRLNRLFTEFSFGPIAQVLGMNANPPSSAPQIAEPTDALD